MKAKLLNKILKIEDKKNIIPLLLFSGTFLIYLNNLSPSVYGGDSGDLITAALTRGVPHPSGYPLYTLLGIVFTSLPFSVTPAWKFALVSAIISSLSVVIFYLIAKELTKSRYLSATTSLTLAFSYTFWLHAEIVEVFALNSFFILTLIYLTIKYLKKKQVKTIYLLAFIAGLSLTNNLSIVILFPVILVTLFIANKNIFFNLQTILKGLIYFLLGLIPYLYIPIAARNFPLVNWGFAVNFTNFTDLVLRKYYGWGFSATENRLSYEIMSHRFKTYFDYWKSYIHNLIPFFIVAGMIQLLRKKKYLLLFLIGIPFVLFGPVFLVYSGTYFKSFLSVASLEKFFIANFLLTFLLIPFGVIFFQELLLKLPIKSSIIAIFKYIIILILTLIPLTSLITNFSRTNFSNNYIGDNLAKDVLSLLPENSILLIRNDSLSFNSIYYQQAYNFRADVSIPGPHNGFEENLLALGKSSQEINKLKIDNKGQLDKDSFNASIALLMKQHDVYIDGIYSLTDSEYGKIVSIPFGLIYKLEFFDNLPYPKEIYLETVKKITDSYQINTLEVDKNVLSYNLILADIKKLYSIGYLNIANYIHSQYAEDKIASEYLLKSIKLDPLVSTEGY